MLDRSTNDQLKPVFIWTRTSWDRSNGGKESGEDLLNYFSTEVVPYCNDDDDDLFSSFFLQVVLYSLVAN